MNGQYSLEKTNADKRWDKFIEASPNGTVFSLSKYLDSLGENYSVYYCYKKKEIRAAVALMEDNEGRSAELHDFVIYNGIMFGPRANAQNRYQVYSEHFKIATFLVEEISNIYQSVSLSLDPSIIDVRPFLWYNFNTKMAKYQVDIRYTSYVDIASFSKCEKLEDIQIFRECSSARRQEIRYGLKKGVYTGEVFDADLFVEFYNKTMRRQGLKVPLQTLEQMKKLITQLFFERVGRMFVSYTAKKQPGSMAFWGIDSKRAYFIFAANDPKLRNEHTGSMILWDSFLALSKDGVKEVDLEGVNSPHRGWFKLSFGGDIRPYYHLRRT